MQIELKELIDQLTEALNLPEGQKLGACVDYKKKPVIQGWCIVRIFPDGRIEPINKTVYPRLKDVLENLL